MTQIKCRTSITSLIGALLISSMLTGCTTPSHETNTKTASASVTHQTPLSVLYAGSMTHVMENEIRPAANAALHIDFQGEGAGSAELAHMITAKVANPDVFISASPSVDTNDLMGPSNGNAIRWYLTLASDQLVIAYAPHSRFRSELQAAAQNKIPWYKVLATPGLRLGRTDPNLDPKGADTILMMKLAEKLYHQPHLEQTLLGSDENPKQVYPEEDLIAQLTSGQMDAVIAYKHEAIEWHVPYITLPNAINLGDPADAKTYAQVSWQPTHGKPVVGAPILFTITVPERAPHASAAVAFVRYMVDGQGHTMLMRDGFTATKIEVGGDETAVPHSLSSTIQGKIS
ncbi:extracellular solute-binding protein [Alicyclobacillus hesperidum]|uniref:extracellular solute-binding protein n=1 Tax=Alicyclobacillus hesperidum TaxID=89784 RepID=UPI002491E73E|nr:extracellular solute-binding protein [Alicyclobacillus hesperidum]